MLEVESPRAECCPALVEGFDIVVFAQHFDIDCKMSLSIVFSAGQSRSWMIFRQISILEPLKTFTRVQRKS